MCSHIQLWVSSYNKVQEEEIHSWTWLNERRNLIAKWSKLSAIDFSSTTIIAHRRKMHLAWLVWHLSPTFPVGSLVFLVFFSGIFCFLGGILGFLFSDLILIFHFKQEICQLYKLNFQINVPILGMNSTNYIFKL
jgi:hypothetical protein